MKILFAGFASGTVAAWWLAVPFWFLVWAAVLVVLAWLLGWSKAWDDIEDATRAWRCPGCGRPGADTYRDLTGAWFAGEREARLRDQRRR